MSRIVNRYSDIMLGMHNCVLREAGKSEIEFAY